MFISVTLAYFMCDHDTKCIPSDQEEEESLMSTKEKNNDSTASTDTDYKTIMVSFLTHMHCKVNGYE